MKGQTAVPSGTQVIVPAARLRLHPVVLAVFVCCGMAQVRGEMPGQVGQGQLGEEAYQLLASFYEYDRDVSLDARIVGEIDLPEGAVDKVVFRSRDSQVVAYLGVPKSGSPPYPCVLLLHGLGLDKMSWWEDDNDISGGNLTKALLRRGVAVLTPDAQYHGERTHVNSYEFTVPMAFRDGLQFRFRDMVVQSVVDCRRAMDYLETRPEIDKARIGALGYSLGSIEVVALSALDSRIKASVACVIPLTHLDRMGYSTVVLPGSFASRMHDHPFLMVMGRDDEFSTEADTRRFMELVSSPSKELTYLDSGHVLPREYVDRASAWLEDKLK